MFEAGAIFLCDFEAAGIRLDIFLSQRLPEISRSRIQKWIEEDCFSLNDKPVKKNATLSPGDAIRVNRIPESPPSFLVKEDLPLNIVYEDEDVVVVNKPRGLVSHPGHGVPSGTLANALAFRYHQLSSLGGELRPGLVHRLDKDTTGLMLVARHDSAHSILAQELQARLVSRQYQALVFGLPDRDSGEIAAPLGRHQTDPLRRSVRPDGKQALTFFQVKSRFAIVSHLELKLMTGRTHQIRVHVQHAGWPVLGDPLYGGRQGVVNGVQPLYTPLAASLLKVLPAQALHAWKLGFTHPRTRQPMSFECPLPHDFEAALKLLEPHRMVDISSP